VKRFIVQAYLIALVSVWGTAAAMAVSPKVAPLIVEAIDGRP
jgi:hypothetical protein